MRGNTLAQEVEYSSSKTETSYKDLLTPFLHVEKALKKGSPVARATLQNRL